MDSQVDSPAYLYLIENGELERRARLATERLQRCDLCPWACKSDRINGVGSVCRTGALARVSSYGSHHGEENPLRGWGGSGTIFFSSCNLRCQYCQNWEISQSPDGRQVDPADLAAMMLELQAAGCHNINLVTPSHVTAQILAALVIAAKSGLRLPLVYNTGGYDSAEQLDLLDGVIDIYMPDMKYASPALSHKYSKAKRYPEVNRAAVKEMHRQVGDLQLDPDGLARRGLLVRHLVLPHDQAGTQTVMRFLAEEVSPRTYVNLMDQYHPDFNVRRYPNQFPRLKRPIRVEEYQSALAMARAAGLQRLHL